MYIYTVWINLFDNYLLKNIPLLFLGKNNCYDQQTLFKLCIMAYRHAICPMSLLIVNSRLLATSASEQVTSETPTLTLTKFGE